MYVLQEFFPQDKVKGSNLYNVLSCVKVLCLAVVVCWARIGAERPRRQATLLKREREGRGGRGRLGHVQELLDSRDVELSFSSCFCLVCFGE